MFIKINGKELPYPSTGLQVQRQQLVDSKRNAMGEVVAQKINRRLFKFNNLKWSHLTASQWQSILQEIEKFEGELTFYNALTGKMETKKVYWGDATEEVFKIDTNTGAVLEYINCQCNIIDMGL